MKSFNIFVFLSIMTSAFFTDHSYACSVLGYLGNKSAKSFIIDGLDRMQMRGYDSSGIAFVEDTGGLVVHKEKGKVTQLKEVLAKAEGDGKIGIGHTRWATHGEPSQLNAHPHLDNTGTVAVVHNGDIDNFVALRDYFTSIGHIFKSETDTEVIPHVLKQALDKESNQGNLVLVMKDTVNTLKGAYAFIGMIAHHPNKLVAAASDRPIVIGIGKDEIFIASDPQAFAGRTQEIVTLRQNSFAIIEKNSIELYDFSGAKLPLITEEYKETADVYDKNGYAHYMLKEIYEQSSAIQTLVKNYRDSRVNFWSQFGISANQIKQLQNVHLFGCGTSSNAAAIAKHYFQKIAKLQTIVNIASEFHDPTFFNEPTTLNIAISQSGETADVIKGLRLLKSNHADVFALVNRTKSVVAREANGFLPLFAGPEVAVASTKAFTTQIAALYWLAHAIALEKGLITSAEMDRAGDELVDASIKLQLAIDHYKIQISQIAKRYSRSGFFTFLGKEINSPFAQEASLKLTEITSIPSAGYPSGEMKHGRIVLAKSEFPVVLFSHQNDEYYRAMLKSAGEVKSRGAEIISFLFEGQDELSEISNFKFTFQPVAPGLEPLVMSGLMQLFAYEIAKDLGKDIDNPEKLAKTVTVE